MMNSHEKQHPDNHHYQTSQGDMMNNYSYSYSSGTTVTTELIQRYLDENRKLILAILDNQSLGKLHECATYQAKLQNNLFYLAAIADAQPQPPPPNLPVRTSPMLQPGQQQYVQPQHYQQQQQIVNQSILGKSNTYLSYLHPMHTIRQQQQQQQFFLQASSGLNANDLFNMPSGYEMGGGLDSSGSIHDFSNGLTNSTAVQGNMVLNANRPDHGDPINASERGSGPGQGALNSDTYLAVPDEGKLIA